MPVANRVDLYGKGRTATNAAIAEFGAGWFVSGAREYHFRLKDAPDELQALIDPRVVGGVAAIHPSVPRVSFETESSPRGLSAKGIEVVRDYGRALIFLVKQGSSLRVLCPSTDGGSCYLISKGDPKPGAYTATIYPAMATGNGESADYVIRVDAPFNWEGPAPENGSEYGQDPALLELLVDHAAAALLPDTVTSPDAERAQKALSNLGLSADAEASAKNLFTTSALERLDGSETVLDRLRVLAALDAPGVAEAAYDAARVALGALGGLSLDLETTGESAVYEVGYGWGDTYVHADEARVTKALAALPPSPDFLVGHNVLEWDLPHLERNGVALTPKATWDTLHVEALLRPRRRTFALRTSHRADEDARVGYHLFLTQAVRASADPDRSAEVARHLGSSYEAIQACLSNILGVLSLDHLRVLVQRAEAEADGLLQTKKVSALAPLVAQELEDPGGSTVHVVVPRQKVRDLVDLKGCRILAPPGDPVALELSRPPDEEGSLDASLIRAFYDESVRSERPPSLLALSPWAEAQCSEALPKYTVHGVAPSAGEVCVIPSDRYGHPSLGSAPDPTRVIRVYPELDLAAAGRVVLERTDQAVLDPFLDEHGLWARLSPGRSVVGLTPNQAVQVLRLLGHDGAETAAGRVALERYPGGTIAVVATPPDVGEVVADRYGLEVETLSLPSSDGAAVRYVYLSAGDGEGPAIRLNPDTPYRDRYWSDLTFCIDALASRGPLVVAVDRDDEQELLEGTLSDLGHYVARYGSLQRRIELLRSNGENGRVLVLDARRIDALLACDGLDGLTVALERLPVERWGPAAPAGVAPTLAAGAKDAMPDPQELDDVDADEDESDGPLATPSRQFVDDAVAACGPYVAHLAAELSERGATLVVFDPRFAPPGPTGLTDLKRVAVPPWSVDDGIERLQVAQRRFRPSISESEFEISEGWLPALERVFLRGRGPGGSTGRFRDVQRAYLEVIVERSEDWLVALPTGGGKSVLYQGPALYRGLRTGRLTLVISPLKALMVDQSEGLHDLGFYSSVEALTSDLPRTEVNDAYRRIAGGELSLVFAAPERLRSRSFKRALEERIERDGALEYVVFDEAHCISQWGHEFRPDYLSSMDYFRKLRKMGQDGAFVFLSATVTEQVFGDIDSALNGRSSRAPDRDDP